MNDNCQASRGVPDSPWYFLPVEQLLPSRNKRRLLLLVVEAKHMTIEITAAMFC